MLLLSLRVNSAEGDRLRRVSVWVRGDDRVAAMRTAVQALARAGWFVEHCEEIAEASADDYFRACPSEAAFNRAATEGLSWRFDD